MDQHHSIRKNLAEHFLNEPQIREPIGYHIIKFFPRKRLAGEGACDMKVGFEI
jgi:hypothetical protein